MNDNPARPTGHVENTTLRDPATHIAGAQSAGSSAAYITDMEAAGRQQLAESDLMPAKGDWADLEQLGFTNRGPVPDDPIFVHADIPAGWRREGLKSSTNAAWHASKSPIRQPFTTGAPPSTSPTLSSSPCAAP